MFANLLQQLAVSFGALLIIAAVLVVVLVIGAVWFYKTRINRWDAERRAYGLCWLPPRLHLVAVAGQADNFERTEKRVNTLLTLGFQQVGQYTATNYDPLKVVGLVHPDNGCAAVVYYVNGIGTWADLVLPGSDDWVSASNVRKRFHFLHLPGERKFHECNMSEEQLLQVVLKNRDGAAAKRLDAANFAAEYESAFARNADQRLLEPVEDFELRQMLREMELATPCGDEEGCELSEKEFAAVKHSYRTVISKQLASACALDFVRTGLSASEWQRSRNSLLVIHDHTPLTELTRRSTSEACVTPELKKKIKSAPGSQSPRSHFVRINSSLPIKDRYQKLGTVEKPVPADIYRAPLKGFST